MSPRSQASHALRTTSRLSSDLVSPSGRERASPRWATTSTFSCDIAPAVSLPGQSASSRTTVSTRWTSARVVRKFVMQARRPKRPSTVAFDR
jgi:hypothetical protein